MEFPDFTKKIVIKRMVKYVVYASDGRILKTGSCPSTWLLGMAGENEFVIEGEANDLIHWVDTSLKKVIDKPSNIKAEEDLLKQVKEQKELKDYFISDKMNEILRNMAIEELKKEGKLDKDGNLIP